ncbi:hypothetical protein niasHT_000492 [Heterodera trifolii]|uniref:Uncharacterized protein n=1 Tax=Heterodera trifolii TaxID=157864 RepID=A0ABD2LU06_9BILA
MALTPGSAGRKSRGASVHLTPWSFKKKQHHQQQSPLTPTAAATNRRKRPFSNVLMVPVQPEQQRPTEAVQKTAKMDKKKSAAQLKREAKRAAVLQHAGRAFPWRCYTAMNQPKKKRSWHSDGFVPWLDYLKAKWLLQRQARITAFNEALLERAVEAADDAQAADAVSNDVRTGTSAGGGVSICRLPPPRHLRWHAGRALGTFCRLPNRELPANSRCLPWWTARCANEESFRFICAVDSATAENGNAAGGASARGSQATAVTRLSATFARLYALSSDQLDQEHALAWKEREIALRWSFVVRLFAQCYAGHSTLLTPSKLWQRWDDLRTALKTLDIWRMTLEHRGCARLMRGPTGAHGVVQAFLLSLSAATFTTASSPPTAAAAVGALHTLQQQQNNSPQQEKANAVGGVGDGTIRLEIGLDPESELHRHIQVDGLLVGSSGALRLSMDFQLDLSLKPFMSLRTNASPALPSSSSPPVLYACTAGCQEAPFQIGEKQISLAIKVTRPRTPIIFISEHADQLELVRKTLHVIEVGVDAPAHEQHTVDLNKHGGPGGGGLPTLFWAFVHGMAKCFRRSRRRALLKILQTRAVPARMKKRARKL